MSAPPRYRTAVVVWLAIFPSVTIALTLLGPLLRGRPVIVQAFVLTAIVVPIAVMVIVPWLSRLLARWLHG